jgi:hypothetical protein
VRGRAALILAMLSAPVLTGAAAVAPSAATSKPVADALAAPVAAAPTGPADTTPSSGVDVPHDQPEGHEGDGGLVLAAATGETVAGDGSCAAGATVRHYDVVAVGVDITLNRYGDHDPEGRMFTLASRLPAVKAEEARRAAGVSL